MAVTIRAFDLEDYESAMALWRTCDGIGLSADDTRAGIARHLARNPGLSFVAEDNGQIAGAVLGSHDGRRGYLTHLAVSEKYRYRGVGRALVESCLQALRQQGITKCHVLVYGDNSGAQAFWKQTGWFLRDELVIMSKMI